MASLYIKDPETARLAGELAAKLGITKTEVVRRALRGLGGAGETARSPQSTADWVRAYRARNPLPDRAGTPADKAFYDSLSDEDDVAGLSSL